MYLIVDGTSLRFVLLNMGLFIFPKQVFSNVENMTADKILRSLNVH